MGHQNGRPRHLLGGRRLLVHVPHETVGRKFWPARRIPNGQGQGHAAHRLRRAGPVPPIESRSDGHERKDRYRWHMPAAMHPSRADQASVEDAAEDALEVEPMHRSGARVGEDGIAAGRTSCRPRVMPRPASRMALRRSTAIARVLRAECGCNRSLRLRQAVLVLTRWDPRAATLLGEAGASSGSGPAWGRDSTRRSGRGGYGAPTQTQRVVVAARLDEAGARDPRSSEPASAKRRPARLAACSRPK